MVSETTTGCCLLQPTSSAVTAAVFAPCEAQRSPAALDAASTNRVSVYVLTAETAIAAWTPTHRCGICGPTR